jgi:hypothetical protein
VTVAAGTILCVSIIFPMIPPELLAAPIKIGFKPNRSGEMRCKLPNSAFDAVLGSVGNEDPITDSHGGLAIGAQGWGDLTGMC